MQSKSSFNFYQRYHTFSMSMWLWEILKVDDYLLNNKIESSPSTESPFKKGFDYLDSYFKELKDKTINQLKDSIKQLESAYEDSYKRNKNILSLLNVLYKNSKDNNIPYLSLNKCKNENDTKEVLKYYKEYYINAKDVDKEKIKVYKRINEHTDTISSLLLLNDGRIATCSDSIRIYAPSKDYHCAQVIERQSKKHQFVNWMMAL